MNRGELMDNLSASYERRELVTLVLRPVSGQSAGIVVTGRLVAVAEQYTSRRAVQVVVDRAGQSPLVIGPGMIRDFHVGPRRADDVTEQQVHPSHDPEPDDQRSLHNGGGRACRRCCKFVIFDAATYRVTTAGADECTPVRVELRDR